MEQVTLKSNIILWGIRDIVQLPIQGPCCHEKCMVLRWFHTCMGPWRIFSLVAGVATLGKFCNLHKSKMAAIGRWQNITFLSFNVETSVMPLFCIFLTSVRRVSLTWMYVPGMPAYLLPRRRIWSGWIHCSLTRMQWNGMTSIAGVLRLIMLLKALQAPTCLALW